MYIHNTTHELYDNNPVNKPNISFCSSYESFTIPMPESPGQTKPSVAPQIFVTSPSGSSTQLN